MPCNIGYKSVSRIKIPAPWPQEFKMKTEAPKIDAELLRKIGEDDPEFLEWLQELDIVPLSQEALKRALANTKESDSVDFSISNKGYLEAKAKYAGAYQKEKIEKITNQVFDQFQLQIMKVILELLDYNVVVSEKGLEGEKAEDGKVHKYVKITKTSGGDSTLRFEHFESPYALAKERRNFLGLAAKLGVKIAVSETEENGQPIPDGTIHRDFLRERQ